jgi:hypothetical protein
VATGRWPLLVGVAGRGAGAGARAGGGEVGGGVLCVVWLCFRPQGQGLGLGFFWLLAASGASAGALLPISSWSRSRGNTPYVVMSWAPSRRLTLWLRGLRGY